MKTFIKTVGFILILSFVLVATSNKGEKTQPPVKTAEEIFEAYNGAVFRIRAVSEEKRTQMSGTGFFIDENGTALTAAHVVSRCDNIEGFGGENESLGNFEIIKTDIKNDPPDAGTYVPASGGKIMSSSVYIFGIRGWMLY